MMKLKVKIGLFISLIVLLFSCGYVWADETDLVWSKFVEKDAIERSYAIDVDDCGRAYITGETYSLDFPTSTGAFDTTHNGNSDVFVARLNSEGSNLDYSTFIGGRCDDIGYGIAVNPCGNYLYVTGKTLSQDFPTTPGAFDTSFNGSGSYTYDAFVVKINPSGNRLSYSTFLGGSSIEYGRAIDADKSENAYVIGQTLSSDFPTTEGAFDTELNLYDVFVAKLNPTGSALDYATYLGGSGYEEGLSIATDQLGDAYATGFTYSPDFPTTPGAFSTTIDKSRSVFITKLSASGSELEYSTFLGGSRQDEAYGITVDKYGNAYITGQTCSIDFPTTAGAFDTSYNSVDAFVVKLSPTGNELLYATLLGGCLHDWGYGIAVDARGNAFLSGSTWSEDFPTTVGAFDTVYNGGWSDVFVAKLNETGSALYYSTFLGGSEDEICRDIALDRDGNAYVTGVTISADFPITADAFDTTYHGSADVFVTKLDHTGSRLEYSTFVAGDSAAAWPDTSVPVESEPNQVELPTTYALHQNYPNPFNANTEIRYQTPEDGHVTLKIFNTLGQEVRILRNADQVAGSYTVSWNGRYDVGQEVASGVYFCRLTAGTFSKSIKMVFLK